MVINNFIENKQEKGLLKRVVLPVILLSLVSTLFIIFEGAENIIYLGLIQLNCIIALYNLFENQSRPYSLKKFVFLFIYVFFILANGVQFAHDSNVLTFSLLFNDSDYISFQIIVFFIQLFFVLFYRFPVITPKFSIRNEAIVHSDKNISTPLLVILAIISSFIIIAHYNFNLIQLFARGLTNEMLLEKGIEIQESSIAEELIFTKIIRPIPWACFVIGFISKKRKQILMLLFILMLITIFPTGLDRNATAMYWIPIVVLVFSRIIKGNRFIWFMFISLFVIFPFFDNFRHFNGIIKFKIDLAYLDSMNLDASQLFMATIATNTVTYGSQLLGAILFFVPRAIWPTKPIGSGYFLATSNGGWFTNVSMPFFSEGFINFGFLGILIFISIIATVCSIADKKYWRSPLTLKSGYYLILLGAIIFIMRGDLMSSFAFTVGIMLSYTLAVKITSIKVDYSVKKHL